MPNKDIKAKVFRDNNTTAIFNSNGPEETIWLGTIIGDLLQNGDLIAFNGDLGAGKTSLIKGIALGLKSQDNITSPSFSIINEYTGIVPIFHFDFYRIGKPEDIEDLGYEEYFSDTGVILIEWAKIIADYLPDNLLLINIFMDYQNIFTRKIVFKPKGKRYEKIMEDLEAIVGIGH